MALWDLLGKATGQPVGRLLGGRYRDRVKPYASLLMDQPVGLAADLQLVSAIHDTELVEYLTGSPYVDEIAARPWTLDADGMLPIPDSPGLGLELDLVALEKYSAGQRLLD